MSLGDQPGLSPAAKDIHLGAGRLHLAVRPHLGGGVASLAADIAGQRVDLMRPAPAHTTHFNDLSCYLLAPWSNRVRGGAFPWAGAVVALRRDWPDGTAIHGAFKSLPWEVTDRSPISLRLRCDTSRHADVNWPWSTIAVVRYELDPFGLGLQLAVTNADTCPFPAGLGFHPFWRRRLSPGDEAAQVVVPVHGRYPCEGMLPSAPAEDDPATAALRRGVCVDALDLDDVFAGGGGEIRWPSRGVSVRYECGQTLTHTVVYAPRPPSPHAEFFCLEPVTMVNDGFNLLARGWRDTGVRTLAPGETLEAKWRLHVSLP